MEIKVRNVNEALAEGLEYLTYHGIEEDSRNGPVLVAPEPVMTTYLNPCERVLFSPLRDANPFFHLMEAIYMLAGRNDVMWPAYFASNMKNYSDDGETFFGAYGYRWRTWFGMDQLMQIIQELRMNPQSRRCVLTMWDGNRTPTYSGTKYGDFLQGINGGKDVCCNTHAYFTAREGKLNMTVCCRSNDMILGGYGANAVHFSVLLEYIAAAALLEVGTYTQFSNNFHVYKESLNKHSLKELCTDALFYDYYTSNEASVTLMFAGTATVGEFYQDLSYFMKDASIIVAGDTAGYERFRGHRYLTRFFSRIAVPMFLAWHYRKMKMHTSALECVSSIEASDWRRACFMWMERRELAKLEKEKSL